MRVWSWPTRLASVEGNILRDAWFIRSHSLRRSAKRGLDSASVDTAIAHRPSVPLDLHDMGLYLLGDSFRHRNLPTVSNGRNSFSDCRGSALRLDAFERGTASNTGQLEARDHRGGITVARRKRWVDEGRTVDFLQHGLVFSPVTYRFPLLPRSSI